jgi:hypothetical protein
MVFDNAVGAAQVARMPRSLARRHMSRSGLGDSLVEHALRLVAPHAAGSSDLDDNLDEAQFVTAMLLVSKGAPLPTRLPPSLLALVGTSIHHPAATTPPFAVLGPQAAPPSSLFSKLATRDRDVAEQPAPAESPPTTRNSREGGGSAAGLGGADMPPEGRGGSSNGQSRPPPSSTISPPLPPQVVAQLHMGPADTEARFRLLVTFDRSTQCALPLVSQLQKWPPAAERNAPRASSTPPPSSPMPERSLTAGMEVVATQAALPWVSHNLRSREGGGDMGGDRHPHTRDSPPPPPPPPPPPAASLIASLSAAARQWGGSFPKLSSPPQAQPPPQSTLPDAASDEEFGPQAFSVRVSLGEDEDEQYAPVARVYHGHAPWEARDDATRAYTRQARN